ncbi:MFS transporter [Kineococcus rhizosphaerae]|uniref:Putative MFS family arabinose efflux permease n=1 Tax=Kineococcus rhizosphaerae TaxID=559628 RepID=A0A2T0R6U3_9ACTN|nr:MFS transporter [Kineococcus rhizosphaerae]PRY16889.1 putative MFS family arabinose efflux permease [Kineococcus rhizosphaerae]
MPTLRSVTHLPAPRRPSARHVAAPPATRGVLLVLSVAAASFSLLQSLYSPALSTLQRELHAGSTSITWVLTAYLLSAAVFTPVLGRVGDAVGRRPVFVAVMTALGVGCLLAALAPNVEFLLFARVVQGVGGAALPLAFGILRETLPPHRLAPAIGTVSALVAAGSGLGVVVAGPVMSTFGTHVLLGLPALPVLVAAAAALRVLPRAATREPARVNPLAAGLLAVALVGLLVPVSQAAVWGWSSPATIVPLAVAVLAAVAWVRVENRSAAPLVDMSTLRVPAVWTTHLAALLFGAAMFGVFIYLPQLAQVPTAAGYGFGLDATGAGLLMLPLPVAMFAAGVVGGRLEARFPAAAQLLAGAVVCAVAAVALALDHTSTWVVALEGGAFGIGVGLAYAAMTNIVVRAVPAHQTGAASGVNANTRTIGGALGAVLTTSIVTAHVQASGVPVESGFTTAFAVLSVLALGVAVVTVVGRRLTPVV